ncbi:FeoB-associated Cys-rich membrane protein [Paenibacillus sp. 79R4]|nr:FeoB-associated Cys-rich membrane protein [Paenibacillus sp. 79R4]
MMADILIIGVVFGFALFALYRGFKKSKQGECAGCSQRNSCAACGDANQTSSSSRCESQS